MNTPNYYQTADETEISRWNELRGMFSQLHRGLKAGKTSLTELSFGLNYLGKFIG